MMETIIPNERDSLPFTPIFKTTTLNAKVKVHEFYINDNNKNKDSYKHKDNYIRTTKYTLLTFIPKSILLQFTRLPNIYFLATAIIQSIPIISPLTNITAIIPLVFVLLVSIIREFIEDLGRYKYDQMSNNEKVIVYRCNKFLSSISASLCLGEMVLVHNDENIPADLLLIHSSSEGGTCFLSTSSIDGEKTLKERNAYKTVSECFCSKYYNYDPRTIGNMKIMGSIQCDTPNPDLNSLEGTCHIIVEDSDCTYSIDPKQILLKGCVLKYTEWLIGIVIYSGGNNKIILNSKNPRMKISKIEKKMNTFLCFVFIVQIIMCAGCAFSHQSEYTKNIEYYTMFIFFQGDPKMESFLTFFTYLLLLNTMIPISLIVTMEIVKIIQGFFILWDTELYSHARKRNCKPNNVSLNDELGNVNYIFSDKTGTLTCNKMQFKYCVIGDSCYEYTTNSTIYANNNNDNPSPGKNNDKAIKFNISNFTMKDINSIPNNFNSINVYSKKSPVKLQKKSNNNQLNRMIHEEESDLPKAKMGSIIPFTKNYFSNLRLNQPIKESPTNISSIIKTVLDNDGDTINEFWLALSCCHECFCTENSNGDNEYSGISPDDIELVKTASEQGYSFQKSPNDIRRILIGNTIKELKILDIINFTSDRRRMSIIVQDHKQIKLYIKGADTEIRSRLSSRSKGTYYDTATQYINGFSSKGYRTLMVAYKTISTEEYSLWAEKLKQCDRNMMKRQQLRSSLYNDIEKNLFLLGATMVEDKLQNYVSETIKDIRLAGIKIWVLTGDKVDTAENIALSCNMITRVQKTFRISHRNPTTTLNEKSNLFPELEKFMQDFHAFANFDDDNFWYLNSSQSEGDYSARKKLSANPFSIIIEGVVLAPILQNEEFKSQFLKIALCACTVICCRVSPLQKSLIVKSVKQFDSSSITLSIGDGGNDVSMIMEAHIGIGLYGEEGMRAVQASDYAIGEFHLLRRLLFTHGRTNSNRISQMILYFFYKNFFFTIIHFFFCFYSLGSGQTIIDDWFITVYNLIFTALPLGIQAITDLDIVEEDGLLIKEMMPFIYLESREKPMFSYVSFLLYLFKGVVLGAFNFFAVLQSTLEGLIDSLGNHSNLWYCSVLLYTNIILSVSVTLLVTHRYMTIFVPIIMGVTTFGLYIAFIFIVHFNEGFMSYGTMFIAFASPNFYLTLGLVAILSFVIEYTFESCRFHVINNLSTKLMWLKNNNELNDKSLPTVIEQAKKNIQLMEKYANANYNQIANCSLSCTQINFLRNKDDKLNLNRKNYNKTNNLPLDHNDKTLDKVEEQQERHVTMPFKKMKKLDSDISKAYYGESDDGKKASNAYTIGDHMKMMKNKEQKKKVELQMELEMQIQEEIENQMKYPSMQSNSHILQSINQSNAPDSSIKLISNNNSSVLMIRNSLDDLNQ